LFAHCRLESALEDLAVLQALACGLICAACKSAKCAWKVLQKTKNVRWLVLNNYPSVSFVVLTFVLLQGGITDGG